jgi:transcriptional/translational regulatory protein YebC/TACO1
MSGHSKWHNIQKTKGAADAKRSQAFTKVAREMIVAVKTGGSGDPNNNSRLAAVIAKAKAVNMPNDNIKRTIKKRWAAEIRIVSRALLMKVMGPAGSPLLWKLSRIIATAPHPSSGTISTSTEEIWAPPVAYPGPSTVKA